MENRGKRQSASIFGGMGFYIALLVCVVAAGVVGYFALLKDDPQPQNDAAVPSSVTEPAPVQSASAPDPQPEPAKPVVKDTPIPVEKPVVVPVLEDEPPEEPDTIAFQEEASPDPDPVPVDAVEPMVIVSPLAGETVAAFSVSQLAYDPTLGDWRTHDGIDISADAGTAVVSASAGVVRAVEEDSRMGTTITVEHQDGYVTTYASLQPEVSVLAGDKIPAGAVLGAVGNTSLTEVGLGAHLHFSVSKDGEMMDPAVFLGQE